MKSQEIRSWAGRLLYTCSVEDNDPRPLRTALMRAVSADANLAGADLAGADLADANLAGANLEDANLEGANLADANLEGANLTDANLADANLAGANLVGANLAGAYLEHANLADANLAGADLTSANLTDANLADANLVGANLAGANLAGANLVGANLAGAYLEGIRDDFRIVLNSAPNEVAGLLAKLRAGEVDGSVYQGTCACLVGTIAILQHCNYDAIPGLAPNSDRAAERWFLGIRTGSTPENNPIAAITDDWICEWQSERGEGELVVAENNP
jgi:uncharacterized protein YjbI with pentapeptide repeats